MGPVTALSDMSLAAKARTGFVLAAAIAALLLVGQLLWSAHRVDQLALSQQTKTVNQETTEIEADIPHDQQSVTIWDDAVVYTAERFDQVWVDENLGQWMHDYFGHDVLLVLDRADEVIYSFADGEPQVPPQGGSVREAVEPLVREVRRQLAAPDATPSEIQVFDKMMVDRRPAIASVAPIVPSTDRLPQEPGSETLHVSLRFLDTALEQLGAGFDLKSAQFMRSKGDSGFAYHPLFNNAGATLGYFAWTPFRPGGDLVKNSLPVLILALAILGLIIAMFGRHLSRASKELQAREAQAQHVASHDTLTGLPNRALFVDCLNKAASEPREAGRHIAVLYLDLDRFKNVNDTLGHAAGDELICEVGRRLKDVIRETDIVARFGGDEFAVLQGDVRTVDDVNGLAARIIEAVGQPVTAGGSEAYVGICVGASIATTATASASELLRKSDIALYRAKAEGPNKFKLFSDEMDASVQQRRAIERELRAALAAGDQFRVVYQPLYPSGGAEIVGVEALVRWEHPRLGTLSPGVFIPVAEESGLILQLGEWVLNEACRTVADWPVPYVAVNVSPLQFRSESFVKVVAEALRASGLDAHRLELEVTESVLVDRRGSSATLTALRETGVRIALDDFGTGYSSLSYLRTFRVDKIKIDRSFVSQIVDDIGSQSIVLAMVDLAKALGVEVTAEGVETQEQRNFLAKAGCDQLQGFLMSKPLAPGLVRELLEDLRNDGGRQAA